MTTTVRAGFIGLGNMGVRIADGITGAGIPLTVWARRQASVEPYAGRPGVTVAATPAAVGAGSDVVGICVWSDADVEEVVLGAEGVLAGMAAGGTIAIHSTVSPGLCARLADEARPHGVAVLDAPVSARPPDLRLLVMVGGDDDTVAACRPFLDSFGDPVVHVGPLGSGQLTKLVNNVLLAAKIALTDDALALGEALGLDEAALMEALLHGSSTTVPGLQFLTNLQRADGPPADPHSQTMMWAKKDVALMTEELHRRAIGTEHPVLELGQAGAVITSEARRSPPW